MERKKFKAKCVLCETEIHMDKFTGEYYEKLPGIPGKHKHWCPKVYTDTGELKTHAQVSVDLRKEERP